MKEGNNRSLNGALGKSSIFSLLRPYSGHVALLVLFALAGNGINLLIPLIISSGIDQFIAGNPQITTISIKFAIAAALIMVLNYFQGVIQTYTSETAARDLRKTLADKISGQTYSYIIKANPSRLLTNLTSDIDSIKMFISQAVTSIISSVFIIVGAGIMLISINWRLALAVLIIIPLIGGAFYIMMQKVRPLFKKSREVVDSLNRVISESIIGAMLIRILNSQQQEYNKFLHASATSRDLGLSILHLFAALIPFINFVSNLAILTILALGGHFVINGEMSLGDIAAFNNYIGLLIFPILVIGFMSNMIAHASVSFQRVKEILLTADIQETGNLSAELKGDIELEDVNLTLGEKPVLKSINLNIRGGTKIAVIGPTAAGKTHLLYLLTGLLKPDSGKIIFDGKPIDQYKRESFYKQVGLVFQDSILFNMSIRENIAFGNDIPEEHLLKAIEVSELKRFIDSLPEKLNTIVSERGTSLSGGQKQRIMLARALALNPAVLLLDDFTSRIDRRTEERIMQNMDSEFPSITVITVTQRIAPVEHYEQIVLLMEGEIIASGRHEWLLGNCPEYIQIYKSQRSTSHYELQS